MGCEKLWNVIMGSTFSSFVVVILLIEENKRGAAFIDKDEDIEEYR